MQQNPPRRAPGPVASAPASEASVGQSHEEYALEALLLSLGRGAVSQAAWDKAFADAKRGERLGNLALAFESVAAGRRLKAVTPTAAAEFLTQAGCFFADALGDHAGAVAYLERALSIAPAHAGAFSKLGEILSATAQSRKLAELHASAAAHKPRAEQAAFLRRAAEAFENVEGSEERRTELLLQVLRLEPADEASRDRLESILLRTSRFRDVVRLLEQALAAEPPPGPEAQQRLLSRVVELYADKLSEPERALPYVEQLLALDPEHEGARRVAERLVAVRGVAARAAAALASALEASGTAEQLGHYLSIELENTRGPRRAGLLVRLGRLRLERMGDPQGAFEAFEQAMALDPDDEARARYVAFACSLGRHADAAKALTRLASTAKDAAARARAGAQLGEVLLAAGDIKRAKAALTTALAQNQAPPDAQRAAARALRGILEAEGDFPSLLEILARLAALETDPEPRREVDEQLAELAVRLDDIPRAIAAYERLLSTASRRTALAALAPLYERCGDPARLARLLEERAADAQGLEARALLLKAASVRAREARDVAGATADCRAIVERFGAARDVLAIWIPLLEQQRLWSDLAAALAGEASLTTGPERAQVLARLGVVRLVRLHDAPTAIAAFEEALTLDPQEKTARAALEKLAGSGDHRLAAARILEPLYRRENSRAPLLRALEVRAALADDVDARLEALREAAILATACGDASGALDFVSKGLDEATRAARPLAEWLGPLEPGAAPSLDANRRAAILAGALDDRAVDSDEVCDLAIAAARAAAESGDTPGALGLYRRALAFAPHSNELLAKVDELLRDGGSAEERLELYRNALRGSDPAQRRALVRRIGNVQWHDLGDLDAAVDTFRAALEEDPRDAEVYGVLDTLYEKLGRTRERIALLEREHEHVGGESARSARTRLVEILAAEGDRERAVYHCELLVGDAETSPEQLDAVGRASERLGAGEVARALFTRRAEGAADARERVFWLERLADLESDRRGDLEAAAAAWKQAARIAEATGDDDSARRLYGQARRAAPEDGEVAAALVTLCERAELWSELPRLYVTLSHLCIDNAERVDLALRAARVSAEHLGDYASAARHAGHAFEISPTRADVLASFQRWSVAAGTVDAFVHAIDETLARRAGGDGPHDDASLALVLTKAWVLANHLDRGDEAAFSLREALEQGSVAPVHGDAVLSALETLVARRLGPAHRPRYRRWLLTWSAEHAAQELRVPRLLEWARAEEQELNDPARALDLYRRVLDFDPRSDEALRALARLALAGGDTELGIATLRARRDSSEGTARVAAEMDLAEALAATRGAWREALRSLGVVLAEHPGDARARELVTSFLERPESRGEAVALLESIVEATDDASAREPIVVSLLRRGAIADRAARANLFERLCDLQRDGGRAEEALASALDGTRELPEASGLWTRAEDLARVTSRADAVARVYEEVLARPLSPQDAAAIGERAAQFYDEWFDEADRVTAILYRVFELEPSADWAFDRLKLQLDAAERWDDLFELFDRAIACSEPGRRARLLEEAAQTAKDFANRPDRAIGYFEALHGLRPGDAKLASALERLYERTARHGDLVGLLAARLATLEAGEARRTRLRIAELCLGGLDDPSRAFDALQPELRLPGPAGGGDAAVHAALLERIVAASPRGATRSRAAAWVREHYAASGRDADVARVLLVELEETSSLDERRAGHMRAADLYERAGEIAQAMDQLGIAATLSPEDDALRARLAGLAERCGDPARLATILAEVATAAGRDELRAALTLEAATIRTERAGDEAGAIDLLERILAPGRTPPRAIALEAARRLDGLLDRAGRRSERLERLEQLAALEPEAVARRDILRSAARLAESLGLPERAVALWERVLATDTQDFDAADALVALLEVGEPSVRLAEVLRLRSERGTSLHVRRADRARAATLLGGPLGRPSEAIEAWTALERDFGRAEDSCAALEALWTSAGRWRELCARVDERAAEAEDARQRADRLAWLGEILEDCLGETREALAAYSRALASDSSNDRARTRVRALATGKTARRDALDVLVDALRRSGHLSTLLELTPMRLAAAADDVDARAAVLAEAADLAERSSSDASHAFEWTREAFILKPEHESTRAALARRAGAADAWPALVCAYREVLASERDAHDRARIARLASEMAVVLETRLGDRMGALEAHRRALDADASDDSARAAVRLAGSLGDWAAAAHAVVRFAHAGSPVAVGALLETLERAVFEAGAWREAATALAAAAGSTAVEGADARDLYTRVANWLIRDGADPDGAEGALKLALGHDPGNLELLKRLAELQRRDPDRELLTTLLALADVGAEPLDALREAATIARSVLGNFGLARDFARRAIERVRVLGCELPADNGAAWAVETLVAVAEHDGDDDALVTALITASELLLPSEARREMRRRAARISLDRLGDTKRGLALFERLFDDDPGDAEAGERLARAYDEETRRSDLLRLRGRQIEAARDLTTRLALRLELARLLADGGQADAAVDTLRAALGESPRDAAAVDRLASLLERGGRGAELRDLLREQAELAERAGDVSTAATWWSKAAACVARGATGDLALAAEFYRRAVTLGADPRWCDALARIAETRGEYDEAAGWHERVASASDGAHKEQALLRLADALVRAGRSEAAIDRIEAALEVDPGAEALQERLAQLYESQRDWTRLAELTARRSEQTHDKATRITCLARAARLFAGECSRPDRAIPLLERAADLVPEDRSLRLALAAALAESGRLGDARAVLRALIDSFGGRKPKERALVHYQMALLELSCGDRARAMTELDTAWRVDPQSAEILRRLAGLARDEGQLERAEKSYRALLVVLRRRDEDVSGVDAVARSEILVELSAIAQRRGEAERAREILESAVEAGLESEFEQTRLEIALRASGDVATLRRLFDSRLAAIGGSPSGSMLLRLGRLAEQDLGDDSGAAVLYERAVAHGHAPLELLRALDGVYVRLGDGENGARVLAMRVEAELGDGAGGSEAADALYRLAALRLAAPTTLDAGAELLQRALDLEPRLDFAEQALQSALAIGPAHPRLIDLLERVGRHEGRERALVDALSRRAQQEDAPMEAVRAAIDTAVAAGDAATAEALLQRRIHGGTGLSSADLAWARAALAALRFRQGDFAHAARLYGELHAEAPADRAFWEALAEVYRRQGDAARLAALVAEVVDSVDDARERAQLRLERIRALRRSGALDDGAAVRELREVLDEAPGHLEAAQWLADLLEARGDTAELVALLALQLDAARDRADASSVASLALRLGKLVEARAPGDRAPRDWYYTGLEWAPESPELLDALLGLLSSEDDAFERADVLERRLAVERGATPRPSH